MLVSTQVLGAIHFPSLRIQDGLSVHIVFVDGVRSMSDVSALNSYFLKLLFFYSKAHSNDLISLLACNLIIILPTGLLIGAPWPFWGVIAGNTVGLIGF